MSIRAEIFGGARAERRLLKQKQPKLKAAEGLAAVPISREEVRRNNSRDKDRYRLNGQVFRVTYRGSNYDAEVVNLSGGGAMLAASLLPQIGECIDLHLGEGGALECAVRWVKGGRLGVEFAHETRLECSDDQRSAVLRAVIQSTFPDERFASEARVDPAVESPAPEFEELRDAKRHPLIWSGELHHGTNSWHVRLRNISATGALLDCPGALRPDSEVVLELDKAGTIFASVSWVVGDHVGLKFDQPFDLQRLSDAKPVVTPTRWLRPDYLQDGSDDGSPWDDAWNRLTVDDLRNQLEGFLKR